MPIRRSLFAYLVAALLLALSFTPSTARADDSATRDPGARVEELKKRGNQAMMELNYGEALDAYTKALGIAPDDAALYYNLGRAHQAREDYPEALDALATFVQKASPEVRAKVPKLDELLADVRSRVGAVQVACTADVPGATITVGEKATIKGCATAPRTVRLSVPARQAVVEVRLVAETYQGQTVRVAVAGGGAPAAVTLTVLAKASSGTLIVRASPAEARISIDGTERGNPPVEVLLPAGAHVVDVRAERHDPKQISVVIQAGATKDLPVVELQRLAPITAKWWFWTGVGVLAVGAGVAVWYLVTQPESSASTGTIAPGQVSAPLVRF
jgi:hypothetical protein